MRVFIAVLALSGALAADISAEQLNCKAQTGLKKDQAPCEPTTSKAENRRGEDVSRADAARNDRAQTRNILQSIEGELRRRRLEN